MERSSWRDPNQGVPHPREGFTFRDLPPETQDVAHQTMASFSSQRAPALMEDIGAQMDRIRAGRPGPKSANKLASLDAAKSQIGGMRSLGMEASVDRVHETAMAPIRAVQGHAALTGEKLPVLAGEFYPLRHQLGKAIAERSFGEGTDEALRMQIATPEFSARMAPQQEIQGAAGMAAMLQHGQHVNMHVGEEAAALINSGRGGSGGARALEPGSYSFSEMAERHPQAAAMLLGHHVKQQGIVAASSTAADYSAGAAALKEERSGILSANSSLDLPEELHEAAGAMVRGYGITGYPKGGRALSRFHTPVDQFGGSQFHKIPTYTWNIHNADADIAEGTRHMLGALAHGDSYWDENPGAASHMAKMRNHPGWNDPSSTMDVWSAKAASGMPYHVARSLGENTNPDKIMTYLGAPSTKRRGERYGSPADVGYLWGEEAHRQAAERMSVNVPGSGKMSLPPHVVQSLSWYGIQGEEQSEKLASGKRTMAPTSASDPRSLNPLQFPKVF